MGAFFVIGCGLERGRSYEQLHFAGGRQAATCHVPFVGTLYQVSVILDGHSSSRALASNPSPSGPHFCPILRSSSQYGSPVRPRTGSIGGLYVWFAHLSRCAHASGLW